MHCPHAKQTPVSQYISNKNANELILEPKNLDLKEIAALTLVKVKRFDHFDDLHQLRMQIRLTMVK